MTALLDRNPIQAVDEKDVELVASDGYRLHATLYSPPASGKRAIVFNGGGGLAVARYRHFLRFVASHGFAVLAYDYRGVGRSRPLRLRGFDAGIEDWSERDHAAAIAWMRDRHPAHRLCNIAHSIGALIACASPGSAGLDRVALIAPHTGYWRDYATPWRPALRFAWHVAMPAIAGIVGYFPGRALRIGDDFPLRFARQWAGRRTPAFEIAADDAHRDRALVLLENLRTFSRPVLALGIGDDAFASRDGIARFASTIPRASVTHAEIDPVQRGRGAIGHFGFFSRRHADAWSLVTDFLASPQETVAGTL